MLKVSFNYADRQLSVNNKLKLRGFIEDLFKQENKSLNRLTYVFCSDEFLLQINKDFLKHDYYTDIVTFDLSEGEGIIGEIYISTDRVKNNATILKVPLSDETLRVIFHGALHLCGFKDKKASEIKLMRELENRYINAYKNVPRETSN